MLEKIEYLKSKYIDDIEHSGAHLLSHLIGTKDLLKEWGASEDVYNAGLFHSVYGTEHFKGDELLKGEGLVDTFVRPEEIEELIGKRAEFLVRAFCNMKRRAFVNACSHGATSFMISTFHTATIKISLKKQDVLDLCNILVANDLEQLPRRSIEEQLIICDLLCLKPYILIKAYDSIIQYINKGKIKCN